MRKDTENLQIAFFSNLGENPRIHQEEEQTAWNESFHRLGPSASSAIQDLMRASAQESPAQGSMEPRPEITELHSHSKEFSVFLLSLVRHIYLGTVKVKLFWVQ